MSGEFLLLEASAPPLEEGYEPRLMCTWRVAALHQGSEGEGSKTQQSYPTFLYNDSMSLSQSLATVIKKATLSIDFQLLALQISNTRIVIVDISSHKRWTIDIKSSETSTIIRNGIIWSDHGGNSQDLIIVTNRGLEMYKISSVRSQCKLSRHLPHDILHFWYEPLHRMLLLQVRSKTRRSIGAGDDEPAYMTGYFFKTDKSDNFPKLELPPPDRIPKFQLDAELQRPENLALVSVYGSLYCAVYHKTAAASPVLFLDLITKTHVTRTHVLPLSRTPEVASLSVVDDLIVAHFSDSDGSASAVFDIGSDPPLCRQSSLYSAAPEPESKAGDEPFLVARNECYGHKWSFLSPDLVWDRWNGRIHTIRPLLSGLSDSLRDAPTALGFLSRRGRCSSSTYCAEAKGLMIGRLNELHATKVGLSWLETAYNTVSRPYGNICKGRAAAVGGERGGGLDLRRQLMSIFGSEADGAGVRGSPDSRRPSRGGGGSSEPLEDPESFYAFLPHLVIIAGKCLDRLSSSAPAIGHFGGPLIRRDEFGSLVLTQTELLAHVWLPLVSSSLDGCAADAEYCSWALMTCMSSYRGAGATVHPAMSILLLNVLARTHKYTDIVRFFQLQFFSDSSDLAVSALQLADTIEDEELGKEEQGVDKGGGEGGSDEAFEERRRVSSAVVSLRQASLDMLWRINERETVIRWLLGHGHTLEALLLCRRCMPEWRLDGIETGITALEVFNSAVLALRFVGNEDFEDFNYFVASELACKMDRDSLVSRESKEQREPDVRRISVTLCPSGIEKTVESERAELMFTVQRFIADWDKDALLRSAPNSLAAQTTFPDELFDSIHAMKFRTLFGFV